MKRFLAQSIFGFSFVLFVSFVDRAAASCHGQTGNTRFPRIFLHLSGLTMEPGAG
jgi:hypothetical protein